MSKKVRIAMGVCAAVVVVFGILIGVTVLQNGQNTEYGADAGSLGVYELDNVKATFAKIDYNKYDLTDIIEASEESGNLPENVVGDRSAPVKIIEYADYQCNYCALMNAHLKQVIEACDGQVAFVVRPYILSYHPNGVAAASAANAAAIQGYWEDYKDRLFLKQDEWFYSDEEKRQQQFEEYFMFVSNNKGDLGKFRADMKSKEVAQKVAFDMGAAVHDEVGGTPYFYLDGEWIKNEGLAPAEYAEVLVEKANQRLAELKKNK